MGFEDLEVAATAAVIDALANAEAVFGGGVRVRGIFEEPGVRILGTVSATVPTFTFRRPAELEVARGDEVAIGTHGYQVIAAEAHDAGLITLGLSA